MHTHLCTLCILCCLKLLLVEECQKSLLHVKDKTYKMRILIHNANLQTCPNMSVPASLANPQKQRRAEMAAEHQRKLQESGVTQHGGHRPASAAAHSLRDDRSILDEAGQLSGFSSARRPHSAAPSQQQQQQRQQGSEHYPQQSSASGFASRASRCVVLGAVSQAGAQFALAAVSPRASRCVTTCKQVCNHM